MRIEVGWRRGIVVPNLVEDLFRGVAKKWPRSGDAFVQNHSDREEISSSVDGLAPCLLGRHVRRCARTVTRLGEHSLTSGRRALVWGSVDNLREAEVQDFHLSARSDHNVSGFYVPVHDSP